ncbi:DUF3644 domain-containing protein [Vibrio parahaemolyticus]|nr:DUF3644 domain-containing protein [Vibrio parahaemolyticus]
MKVNKSHERFLCFLQEKERTSKSFTKEELISATGWKESTFKTYFNKGQLSDFLSEVASGSYEASNSLNLSLIEFSKKLSQSKHRRGLGHNCKSKLAKALLRKSRDNMLLALELYNRPSLENRMDGFVMCFCTAWEQLLKAMIIEEHGESTIFKKLKRNGIKETISLREAINLIFPDGNKVKANLEKIVFFRDQAVHLLMPEIQGIASRLFQSGVLNYSAKFEEFSEQSFLNSSHTGMISLVGDFKYPPVSVLKTNYGDVATEILTLAESLTEDVQNTDDIEFAIPLNVKLVFAKDGDVEGQPITLAKAEDGMEGLKKALIVHKPIDREKSHPYLESSAIKKLNDRLKEQCSEEALNKFLVARCKKSGKPTINQHCFRAVVDKLKVKNANNEYHHKNCNPELHYYSDSFIDLVVKKVIDGKNFIENAKKSYKPMRKGT